MLNYPKPANNKLVDFEPTNSCAADRQPAKPAFSHRGNPVSLADLRIVGGYQVIDHEMSDLGGGGDAAGIARHGVASQQMLFQPGAVAGTGDQPLDAVFQHRLMDQEVGAMRENLPALMSGVAELAVPLVVDVGAGPNWDKAH